MTHILKCRNPTYLEQECQATIRLGLFSKNLAMLKAPYPTEHYIATFPDLSKVISIRDQNEHFSNLKNIEKYEVTIRCPGFSMAIVPQMSIKDTLQDYCLSKVHR
mgnify:CR=1 FL=1